jgi:hypothetical protein
MSFPFQRLVSLPAGAVLALLALGAIAPPGAQAACSHLVTSRTDRHESSTLTESLLHDLAAPSDPLPMPSGPRPCSGAFCSGQPAAPAVPAGVTAGRIGSWAWYSEVPAPTSTETAFLSRETSDPDPMRRAIAIFRPPRLLPPA